MNKKETLATILFFIGLILATSEPKEIIYFIFNFIGVILMFVAGIIFSVENKNKYWR